MLLLLDVIFQPVTKSFQEKPLQITMLNDGAGNEVHIPSENYKLFKSMFWVILIL